ncbi:hypothetical protein KM043_014356 [Ampulex compressa]|nr:hypothetical protein KM043_014356 [Ampulex compressa]
MLFNLTILLLAGATLYSYAEASEDLYSDKYDYIDVIAILENDRLRNQYYQCFMDTGPCVTPDAVFFKGNFPEAVVTKCKKCTEIQKINFEKLATWYTEHLPDEWKALVEKFINDQREKNSRSEE